MEKLGTGSFGTVYKAMHNETKQIVAVKQIGASSAPNGFSVYPSLTAPPLPDGSFTPS
jgi:serine/threonine protein kinase